MYVHNVLNIWVMFTLPLKCFSLLTKVWGS